MFMGEFYSVVDDLPYTRGEIAKLLSSAHSIRDRIYDLYVKFCRSSYRRPAKSTAKAPHLDTQV